MIVSKEIIGLDYDDIALYRSMFIKNENEFKIKRIGKHGWLHESGFISNDMLLEHFAYHIQLGVLLSARTNSICIDLDIGEGILERYHRIIDAMGEPSFVLQSSTEKPVSEKCPVCGGFHLWYFSEIEYSTYTITSGVKNYLKNKAIEVKSGYVEVKPTETQALRIPLHTLRFMGVNGCDCPYGNHLVQIDNPKAQLFNHDTWQPLTFKESIAYMAQSPRIDLRKMITYASPLTTTPTTPICSYPSIQVFESNKAINSVGLGTRNDTWLEWVQKFAFDGHDENEIYNKICNMMDSGSHNKGSKDWEHNREQCQKQLKRMIELHFKVKGIKWYPRPERNQGKPSFLNEKPLSNDEVAFIFSITKEVTKNRYDYRMQRALFHLLKVLKEKLSRDLETVPIAIEIFSTCLNNKSNRHSGDFKNFCIEHNIITLTSRHNYQNHKADEFFINKSLFHLSSCIHSDFHKAIKSYFKDDIGAIKINYSPTYSKRILL